MTFDDLNLDPRILSAVTAAGYATPTPIQEQAIPAVLGGRDVTGIAQTGTGKTAAFVLPMVHKLGQGRAKARMPRSLILEPTRELAAQVSENFDKYGANYKLNMALLIGGVSFGDQDKKITAGVDVLIATPGRLLDHFERGRLLLTGVQMLVIDEADRMLDMGFIPDIERICSLLPATRQTMLFSATMPPEITRLARQFQKDPLRIEVAKPATAAATITQYVTHCPSNEDTIKRSVLRSIIRERLTDCAIVFCNRKREVDIVAKSLLSHGFDAAAIHGDLPQSVRTATLDRFRNGELKLLVASDVAARGLDIPEVSQVFNYAPPPNSDDYVHRIGRTGRAGRKGESFTIVSPGDSRLWDAVLKRIGKDVDAFKPGSMDAEVSEARSRGPAPRRDRFDPSNRRRGRRGGGGAAHDHAPADPAPPGTTPPGFATKEAPPAEREGGRRGRRRRGGGDALAPAEASAPPARMERGPGRKRRGERGQGEDGVKGMGDHMPDFLRRSIETFGEG
jgi:superfamily II DNA/RNA helicase